MKKLACLVLCFVLICGFGVTAFADNGDIALCNNNVLFTDTSFNILSDYSAEIMVSFYGYPGITTGGTVTTLLEKKVNGEWSEVDTWVENVTGDTFYTVYTPQLSAGEYRVSVEYRISGTGGADDVINEQIERSC